MSLNKFSRPKGLTESQAVQKKSNRDYSQCRNPTGTTVSAGILFFIFLPRHFLYLVWFGIHNHLDYSRQTDLFLFRIARRKAILQRRRGKKHELLKIFSLLPASHSWIWIHHFWFTDIRVSKYTVPVNIQLN